MKVRLLCILLVVCGRAWADGPHVALHATVGAYTSTLFTAPDPLVAGQVSFELLLQNEGDNSPVPLKTAQVELDLTGQPPLVVTLAPAGSSPVLSAEATLPKPGTYRLRVDAAGRQFSGELPVAENHGKRDTVLWTVLLPFIAILLFLANQSGKQRIRELR